MLFDQHIVVLTGGARGIGRSVAEAAAIGQQEVLSEGDHV